jgi:hypothetical protein
MDAAIIKRQRELCEKYHAGYEPAPNHLKVGIAENTRNHIYPLNGLRLRPEATTTGWFIWAGEDAPSQESDYFKPLHVAHLPGYCPEVLPYLGLAPGWRFLVAVGYEDIWFDPQLLDP